MVPLEPCETVKGDMNMPMHIEPYKDLAAIYEEVRPGYPEQLINDIVDKIGIKPDHRLLEIGAGTGKATTQFAERGFTVHAVEMGEDMAAILQKKCASYQNVTVEVSSFEQWTGSGPYDMIYSAQAFHWLDPELKYKKCHRLLKDDGYLALFWYNPCDDNTGEAKELKKRIDKIVNRYAAEYQQAGSDDQRRKHDGTNTDQRLNEIEASGLFTVVYKTAYLHETKNNADQYLKQMKSVPAFASVLDGLDKQCIRIMDEEIKRVINEDGGDVSTLMNYTLYITKKVIHK